MVENAFKKALKKSGILEAIPNYNRADDYYTVIKVCNQETADNFLDESKKLRINVKARLYEEGMNIWVFKAYNREI